MASRLTLPSRSCALLLALLFTGSVKIDPAGDLAAQIAKAKAGETVNLPAGEFTVTGVVIPPGVTLKGAGYARTTLNVKGQVGLQIQGAKTHVSDLTIRDAANAGINIEGASDVTIARVRVIHCLSGVLVNNSTNVHLENIVAAENRTGIVMNHSAHSSIANCSLVNNTALALSLGVDPQTAVFNNLLVNSPIGVFVAPENTSLQLDHNLYQVNQIGKCDDTPPASVYSWRDSTGYDEHSLSLTVALSDVAGIAVKPATNLNWAPDRAVTDGWGVTSLGGFKAPDADIDAQPFLFGPAVGAYESKAEATRPPDGKFSVASSEGLKSAGLYDASGRNVAWLFSNLPLHQGEYSYWLPTRDWQGQPIPAGSYQLRIAEANLRFKAVGDGIAANTGSTASSDDVAAIQFRQPLYDSKGHLVLSLGWSESGKNIRSFDPELKHGLWAFPGVSDPLGSASDGKGSYYSLRRVDKDQAVLVKLDEATGDTQPLGPSEYSRFYKGAFLGEPGGMALFNGSLFLADPHGNKLWQAPLDKDRAGKLGFDFQSSTGIPSPSSPCTDTKRDLLWVLSGHDKILALDTAGAIKYQFNSPVADVSSLSVNAERLALVSLSTGKVHVLDISDPAHPKPLFSVGRGDGPYGPMQPDRFLFQGLDAEKEAVSRVALSPGNDLCVVDTNGIKLFGPDGHFKRQLIGGWYNSFYAGIPDSKGAIDLYDPSTGGRVCVLDSKTGTWKYQGNWKLPGAFDSMFEHDGKRYGVFNGVLPLTADAKAPKTAYHCVALLSDVASPKPLFAIASIDPKVNQLSVRTDFSRDADAVLKPEEWKPLADAQGKPVALPGTALRALPNGDLTFDMGWQIHIYPLKGVDASGSLEYDWTTPTIHKLSVGTGNTITDPYDSKIKATPGFPPNLVLSMMADGSLARPCTMKGGRMNPLVGNWGGCDFAGFDGSGNLAWYQPTPDLNGSSGVYAVDDLFYACTIETSETQVFAKDGMYLGRLGQPKGLPWGGKWLDNSRQSFPYKGADGKHYMVYGDFNDCCVYWMQVTGTDSIHRQVIPVTIDAGKAAALVALVPPAPPKSPAPPVTRVTIAKITEPLPTDGSLEAWRKAIPTPQVIITPESSANIKGPADCSALVRLAHMDNNLYVQVIVFDDIVTMHQPKGLFFKQDGIEMALNSFTNGFKYNVTHVRELGDMILRDRFYNMPPGKYLDPAKAPRKITVLDNASDVPERKIIESIYGVDLSKSKVIVTEFMVPLTPDTYEGDPKAVPDTKPGSTMYIGFLINDNDSPGGDVQKYIPWPATYGTFSGKETGALATFE